MKKKNNHLQKIGTFNCRGLVSSKAKQQMLADDFERYKLAFLAIQETHMKGYDAINMISSTNNSYILYYSGHKTKSENGVGIIIPATKNVAFLPISDLINNKRSKTKPQINYNNLQNETIRSEYQQEVMKQLSKNSVPKNNQQRWTNIVEATTNAAINTLGLKPKHLHNTNPEIKELSEKQKNLKLKLDNTIDNTTKDTIKESRNHILNQIYHLVREQEANIIAQQLLEIERTKNDSTRMFHAIKQMQRLKPKAPLLVYTNEGDLTANEKEQTELISQHFKQQFYKNQEIIPTIPPTPISELFTKEEIKNTIKYLKNNKSTGNDGVKAEHGRIRREGLTTSLELLK